LYIDKYNTQVIDVTYSLFGSPIVRSLTCDSCLCVCVVSVEKVCIWWSYWMEKPYSWNGVLWIREPSQLVEVRGQLDNAQCWIDISEKYVNIIKN